MHTMRACYSARDRKPDSCKLSEGIAKVQFRQARRRNHEKPKSYEFSGGITITGFRRLLTVDSSPYLAELSRIPTSTTDELRRPDSYRLGAGIATSQGARKAEKTYV